jgi:hypothetical protein
METVSVKNYDMSWELGEGKLSDRPTFNAAWRLLNCT